VVNARWWPSPFSGQKGHRDSVQVRRGQARGVGCRKMTDGSLRQSCLAQALNEADAVLRPPEPRRYPVDIAKPQRGIDLA